MPQAVALESLRGLLLVQCRPGDAARLRGLASAEATGMVLTGEQALRTARRLRDEGFRGPLLCDRDRYSGRLRRSAASGVDREWIRGQLDTNGVALTDSGYLDVGDWRGLRTVLDRTAEYARPVIALLPLNANWFRRQADVERLAELLVSAQVPVALVLEHGGDPFERKYVLHGLLRLLDRLPAAAVPLLLLRCDHSVLGALCHGVFAGAVGTHPTLRHCYPATGNRRPRNDPAVFVPSLLAYHGLRRVRELGEILPDLGGRAWECDCAECNGLEVGMLGEAARPRHGLRAQLRLRESLLRTKHPDQRRSAWHETCGHALFLHDQIAERVPGWKPPRAVRTWYQTAPDPFDEARRRLDSGQLWHDPHRAGREYRHRRR